MPRYTYDLDHLPDWQADRDLCLCSVCRAPIVADDWVRSEPIYKLGELDYVQLSHARCDPEASCGDDEPDPDRLNPLGIERGDRVSWPSSFGEHEALGPSIIDTRWPIGVGRGIFRAVSPSGARVDVALPADLPGLRIDQTGRGAASQRRWERK